jgi:hypothetical protein
MRTSSAIFVALLLVLASPIFAQEVVSSAPPNGTARCELTGTWYGGSSAEIPYLATFSPSTGGRYTAQFQLVYTPADIGYKTWTTWTGEALRTTGGEYDVYAISYWIMTPEYAAENGFDTSTPELDMVRSHVKFTDCDTMTNEIDLLTAHIPFDPAVDKPFTGPYDFELPAGETIVETYQRMPTTCCTTLDALPRLPLPLSGTHSAASSFRSRHR